MTTPEPSAAITSVFGALSDRTRRGVLTVTARAGGSTAGEIAEVLGVSRQAAIKHLAVLEDCGIVIRRRDGRAVRFDASPTPLLAAAQWLTGTASSWDDRLDALRSAAEEPPEG